MTMRVVRFFPPGGVEKLKLQDEAKPTDLADGEMLIKVHAVSVIAPEITWPIYQDANGEWVPAICGHDFSGTVEATGPGFEGSDIGVGAEVMAFTANFKAQGHRLHEGAMAEYATADLQTAIMKPKRLTLLEAASVPLSALTAWQALFEQYPLKSGQRLLVSGAAGPTGIWMVQIGKMIGAHVTGTASSQRSFELLKELGVDEIVDYKKAAWEDSVEKADLVVDCVGHKAFQSCLKVVKKDGLILSIATYDCTDLAKEVGLEAKFFIVNANMEQLREISALIDKGVFKTVIDSVLPLEDFRKAFEKGYASTAHGKILLKL